MQVLFFLLFFLSFIASIDMSQQKNNTWDNSEASAMEKAMVSYNFEIIKQCTAKEDTTEVVVCNNGSLTLTNYPRYMLGQYEFYQNNFHSIYDQANNRIITAWIPSSPNIKGEVKQVMADVSALLVANSNVSAYTGSWHQTTQTVNEDNIYTYKVQHNYPLDNPDSYVTGGNIGTSVAPVTQPSTSLPQGTGGLQLIDGSPVIITQF